MTSRNLAEFALVALVLTAIFPADALAYLDPGTGSLYIQSAIAALAAGAYAVRLYWRRIRSLWRSDDGAEVPERHWPEGGQGNV